MVMTFIVGIQPYATTITMMRLSQIYPLLTGTAPPSLPMLTGNFGRGRLVAHDAAQAQSPWLFGSQGGPLRSQEERRLPSEFLFGS